MKIPDSVRIGGVDYTIIYTHNLRHDKVTSYGYINYENATIELSSTDGTSHQRRCCILWHEIIHGIIEHANMDVDKSDGESIVDTIAKGVYQVLQDNGRKLFDLEQAVEKYE